MEIRINRFFRTWGSEVFDGYKHFYTPSSKYGEQATVDINYIINYVQRVRRR